LSFDSIENDFELQDKSFEKRIAGDFSWAIQNLDRKTGTVDMDFILQRVGQPVAGPKGLELVESFRGVAGDRRHDDERYIGKRFLPRCRRAEKEFSVYQTAVTSFYEACKKHLCSPAYCGNVPAARNSSLSL
jgi:hypothetical protein